MTPASRTNIGLATRPHFADDVLAHVPSPVLTANKQPRRALIAPRKERSGLDLIRWASAGAPMAGWRPRSPGGGRA